MALLFLFGGSILFGVDLFLDGGWCPAEFSVVATDYTKNERKGVALRAG